ncbi:MAG: cytochrome c biogenesis protein CcsA [Acidobacteriota bacterium]
MSRGNPIWTAATYALLVLMLADLYLVFIWAPTEKTMGDVQRIFYFHVPSAWVAFLAFFMVFIGSVAYLIKRDLRYDRLALASAEIGVAFCTIVLVTGPIWARPAWGIWWTWDARLTSTLVLWLIYASYLLLRGFVEEPLRKAVLAAVVGIVGFADVPIVYMSIRWWRTQHPSPVFGGGQGSGLDPEMRVAFFFSLAVFTLLFAVLVSFSARVKSSEHLLGTLRRRLAIKE